MTSQDTEALSDVEPQGQMSFSEPRTSEERPDVSGIVHAVEGNANG